MAAAITEHLAFKLQCIPALAIVTVYYSITSCIATLSASSILSNSSIHTIPLSANIIAPASKCLSPVSLSKTTEAVRPTPDDPFPYKNISYYILYILLYLLLMEQHLKYILTFNF